MVNILRRKKLQENAHHLLLHKIVVNNTKGRKNRSRLSSLFALLRIHVGDTVLLTAMADSQGLHGAKWLWGRQRGHPDLWRFACFHARRAGGVCGSERY